MTKIDYSALDSAIMGRIRTGSDPYGGIAAAEASKLEAASNDDPRLRKPALRYIDNRLQALRKQGKISHDRRSGWLIG